MKNIIANFYKLKPSQTVFLLSLFVKQFYIFPSGSFQVGDLLLLISFFLLIFFEHKGKLYLDNTTKILALYVACILVINICHWFFDGGNYFNACAYYLFNLLAVITFVTFLKKEPNEGVFLFFLGWFLKLSLISQAFIFLIGKGKWFGGSRYEGTFNDPNQYGVYIFFCMLLIYATGRFLKKKTTGWMILGSALIVMSASTGTLLGLFAFFAMLIYGNLYKAKPKRALFWLAGSTIILSMFLLLVIGVLRVPDFVSSTSMYRRVISKIMLFNTSGVTAIGDERQWSRLLKYPEMLLYGAGEGNYLQRFGVNLEVHSSILGPLFYYGIVPFSIWLLWVKRNLRGMGRQQVCIIAGLLFESVLLVNTRQPMFWMIIILAGFQFSTSEDLIYNQANGL